jgi:hypothetical protein
MALSQSNTSSKTFSLFIRDLVRQLTVENRRWREKTLIIHDGAGYAQSVELMDLYDELDLPVAISAPHSYDLAPCELYFAMFKSVNINPLDLATGRR